MPKEPPHPRRPLTYYKNPTPPVLKLMIVSDVDLHKSCFYDNCYDMKKMGKVKDIYFNCSYIRVSFEKKNEFIFARIILHDFFYKIFSILDPLGIQKELVKCDFYFRIRQYMMNRNDGSFSKVLSDFPSNYVCKMLRP